MTASPQTEAMLTMRRARRSRREVTVRIVVPLVVIGLFASWIWMKASRNGGIVT